MFLLFSRILSPEDLFVRVAVTWSGGKDCCLACYEATLKGHEVSTLLNFVFTDVGRRTPYKISNLISFVFTDVGRSTPYKVSILANFLFKAVERRAPHKVSNLLNSVLKAVERRIPHKVTSLLNSMFKDDSRMIWHEIAPEIVAMQAQAMEIPIVQTKATWGTFEDQLKTTIRKLERKDAEGVVWGIRPPDYPLLDSDKRLGDYFHIRAEKEWVYQVCDDLDIKPILPLWEKTPEQVLVDFMEKGFEAIIVVVNPEFLSEEWLGRNIDHNFLKEMRKLHREKGIHVVGDEYHTLVTDGPLFKKRLKVLRSRKVSRNGYIILDISKAELTKKAEGIRR
jgi:diphthine-ammonia ligase